MKNDSSGAVAPPFDQAAEASAADRAVRFPIFRDLKGNRFVFPGLWGSKDRSIDWVRCRVICATLGVTEEKERLRAVEDTEGCVNFPHVKADARHRGFLHGGEKVWLIGGPEFDAIKRAEAQ